MPNIRVVTDSACDLSEEHAASVGIEVVPLTIRFGSSEFVDRRDLTPQQFWKKVADSPVLPQTAAPSPGSFEAAFRRAAADGCDGVVCVCLSSKLSATFGSAQLAARALDGVLPVRVIDSLSITMGQGTMALEAARVAAAGGSIDDVAAAVTALIGRTSVFGALDTLDNLKKGGRIGAAQALIGSLLSVKPIVDVSSGAVEQAGKQRTRAKALTHLAGIARDAKARYGSIAHVAVMHGDAPDVDDLLTLLADVVPRDEIVVGQIGAVIGTHGGPRVMGLTFDTPTGQTPTGNPAAAPSSATGA